MNGPSWASQLSALSSGWVLTSACWASYIVWVRASKLRKNFIPVMGTISDSGINKVFWFQFPVLLLLWGFRNFDCRCESQLSQPYSWNDLCHNSAASRITFSRKEFKETFSVWLCQALTFLWKNCLCPLQCCFNPKPVHFSACRVSDVALISYGSSKVQEVLLVHFALKKKKQLNFLFIYLVARSAKDQRRSIQFV